jgi:CRP/FNR family transcriptional activator FtrB
MRPGRDTLKALPFLSGFAEEHLATLNEVADLARVGPDEVLFQEGEQLGELNILLSGFVIETRRRRGDNVFANVVAPVGPLGFAAAMRGTASPTGARTMTSARLVVIPAGELRAMVQAMPDLALPLLDHALAALQGQALELCNLKLRSSVQRLAGYLLELLSDAETNPARFVLPYEKRFLAAKIGCSQENLSRAFAALRRLGVETKGSLVVIKDIAVLQAFVGLTPLLESAGS